jgi:hypothetical protein
VIPQTDDELDFRRRQLELDEQRIALERERISLDRERISLDRERISVDKSKVRQQWLTVPLTLAVIGAVSYVVAAYINHLDRQKEAEYRQAQLQQEAEFRKSQLKQEAEYRELQLRLDIENSRIIEAIKDPERAESRLRLLVQAGLISDADDKIMERIGPSEKSRVRLGGGISFFPTPPPGAAPHP